MKTYLNAGYRLSDLLRAQRNDRITSNLKRWIKNREPDTGDLEQDSYRLLTHYCKRIVTDSTLVEETCDHLINTWIARHGCPMTFQSDLLWRRTYYGAHETTFSSSSGSSQNERLSGKAKSDSGVVIEVVLIPRYD